MPAQGDPLKYVQQLQPLRLPADAWNAFIDTTKAFRAQRRGQQSGTSERPQLAPGLAYVQNACGSDLDQFAVLGIGDALFDPSTAPEEFAERPAFSGVEPTSDHVGNGKLVILLEPAAAADGGDVALCCVAGATVAKINVSDAAHDFADAAATTTGALVSAAAGPLQILWKQSGTGSGKWAVVRFGGVGDSSIRWGKVSAYTAGANIVTLTPCNSAGTATGADDLDVTIALPVSQSVCSFFFASAGDVLAYFVKDGVAWLASVPMPTSTDTKKVYQVTGGTGQGGFDSVRVI